MAKQKDIDPEQLEAEGEDLNNQFDELSTEIEEAVSIDDKVPDILKQLEVPTAELEKAALQTFE